MKISRLLKYFLRFFFLQALLTFFTIYYFDRFLMNEYEDGYLVIINNLLNELSIQQLIFFISIGVFLNENK